MQIKRHGGWKSSNVAEGYIADSISNKMNTTRKILTDPKPGTSTSASGAYVNIQQHIIEHLAENVTSVMHPLGSKFNFNNCTIGTINYNRKTIIW